MMRRMIFAALLSAFTYPAYAEGITAKEAEQLPAPELASKSFADFSRSLKDKSVQNVPTDTGYALFTAQFGAPMIEAAPGICRGRNIKFEYNWDEKNVALPEKVDTIDTYAVVGPIPDDQGPPDDKTTIARCAKLKSSGPGLFTADSDIDAINAMHLLDYIKRLAAGSEDFSLSCSGNDCAHARPALAAVDMKSIAEVHGCGERWFQSGLQHLCEVIILDDDSQKAEDGPNILIVRIKRDDGKISAIVKRDHTMRPL